MNPGIRIECHNRLCVLLMYLDIFIKKIYFRDWEIILVLFLSEKIMFQNDILKQYSYRQSF